MGSGGKAPHALSVTIVVPTRNEAGNIEEFTKRATLAMRDRSIEWEILFADDSDDDTPATIDELARRGNPLRCFHRPPGSRHNSIGGAVKAALTQVDADFVVVIDADLQHPPEILPSLIGPLWFGTADFVIGSRYGPGGSAIGLGSRWRQVASRLSAVYTKLLFPQYWNCSDLASGMFAFRRADFDLTDEHATGFKLLAEALVQCHPTRIAEVSYTFEDRVDGLSKARVADGLTHGRSLIRLRRTTRASQRLPVARDRQEIPLETATSR